MPSSFLDSASLGTGLITESSVELLLELVGVKVCRGIGLHERSLYIGSHLGRRDGSCSRALFASNGGIDNLGASFSSISSETIVVGASAVVRSTIWQVSWDALPAAKAWFLCESPSDWAWSSTG